MAMRLASADVLPMRFATYARDLQVDLDTLRRDVIRRARTPVSDGAKPAIAADASALLKALEDLRAAGESLDRAADAALSSGDTAQIRRVNDVMTQAERAFLDAKGLPNRPWFRHLLIAPGLTTGYAPWPFPALQQAVEERDAAMWTTESQRIISVINRAAAGLR
jgi:N-acetylated-alpha-linked acidic dipeptidase